MRKLTYFLPIPVLIMGVNYLEDPANLFQEGKYEQGIARYLAQGYNVTNVYNCDERLLQKYFIQDMAKCPSEIVLGSSRVMQIKAEDSSDSHGFINNGVSGASLEDDMAIFHMYEKKGCTIKKLIIGLDPYLLNDNHGQFRWKSLKPEYNEFKKELGLKSDESVPGFSGEMMLKMEKYGQLLSMTYFRTSFQYLIHGISKAYQPVSSIDNDKFTRLEDGTISYDKGLRNIAPEKVKNNALRSEELNYSLLNFTNLSEGYKALFSTFIGYLQQKNIDVVFFLAPYHPDLYDYYLKQNYYHIIFDAENFYKKFAKEHKIKVVGSYDPGKYHLDNACFYDAMHAKPKSIQIIMEN